MLSSAYFETALSERTCHEWFQRFKSGNFDVENRHGSGKEEIFKDSELEALLAEDSCQMQEELSESLHGEKFAGSARPIRRTDALNTRRAARPLFSRTALPI